MSSFRGILHDGRFLSTVRDTEEDDAIVDFVNVAFFCLYQMKIEALRICTNW